MSTLLSDIRIFLLETGMGEFRFGLRAASNGRLVGRLRDGGRVWPETEMQVRTFMEVERRQRASEGSKPSSAIATASPVAKSAVASVDPAKVPEASLASVSQSDAETSACPTEKRPRAAQTPSQATR